MALNIVMPNEAIQVKNIVTYIYGDPDMWKTTLGMTAKNALVIDADRGVYRVDRDLRRSAHAIADTWDQIRNLTAEDIEPYDTVVIDTVQRLLEIIRIWLARDRSNIKGDGTLKLNVQQIANNNFSSFVNRLLDAGKDVVIIAHAAEEKVEDKIVVRPELGGKNRQDLQRMAAIMAYLTCEKNDNGKLVRILKFSKGDNYHSKDCAQLGNIEVPDLRKNPTFLGDLVQYVKDKINTLTDEEKKLIEEEQTWIHFQHLCNEAQYASDLNNLMEEMALNTEHPQYQNKNMWYAIQKAAKDLNMTYDKEAKRWKEGPEA